MEMGTVIDNAFFADANERFHNRSIADLGRIRDACKRIDSIITYDYVLWPKKLANLSKSLMRVFYNDLWDSHVGKCLIGNAGRSCRYLQSREVFFMIQQGDVAGHGVCQWGSACDNIVIRSRKKLAVHSFGECGEVDLVTADFLRLLVQHQTAVVAMLWLTPYWLVMAGVVVYHATALPERPHNQQTRQLML